MIHQKILLFFLSGIVAIMSPCSHAASDEWSVETLESNMKKVADWEIGHKRGYSPSYWVNGVFYSGLSQYGAMDPNGPAWPAIRKAGEKAKWNLAFEGPEGYFADDHCIGHAWLELAMRDGQSAPLRVLGPVLEKIVDHPSPASLEFKSPHAWNRWSWCDALFMGPPVFTKMAGYTGDPKYLKFMDREYKATYDYLFDREHLLFWRDSTYFGSKSDNGQHMFWSRGNGWVVAGLALILRDMPEDWPTRSFYIDLLKTMAGTLKSLQQEDGSWHPSLLDPKDPDVKEMSGTLLNTYALIWGVNNGYLKEEEYLPAIKKAWKVISDSILEDGAVGWVQPIGQTPKVCICNEKTTEGYGAGAYLMAAGELRKMVIRKQHPGARTVEVRNPIPLFRPRATVSVPWRGLNMSEDKIRVFDMRDGCVINHQVIDVDGDGAADELLFQADFLAGTTRKFQIFETDTLPAARNTTVCFSRPVPERLDDFAWENDRTAHRVYGPAVSRPAPEGEGLVSSGIDVWSKCVNYPVLDRFYKNRDYHTNHGEGLDWYKVGTGCGCGGLGVFKEGQVYSAANWVKARTLTTGPIRTIFELTYASYDAGKGITVSEKRMGSLDAGSSMTRFVDTLNISGAGSVKAGPGLHIALNRQGSGQLFLDEGEGAMTLWGPTDSKNGTTGTAVYLPGKDVRLATSSTDCIYMTGTATTGKPFVWYMGASWDKAGFYKNAGEWTRYVRQFIQCEKNPLQVTLLPSK